tara:strand:- start:699 stop:1133 length:435 start_codon:yes stop_codon:yes gene_type:complete
MNNIQNIINGGLAVIVTLLIYQNTQLQDKVELLEIYAQQDTDMSFDRIEALEEKLATTDEIQKQFVDNVDAKFKSDDENFKSLIKIVEQNDNNVSKYLKVVQNNFDIHEAKIDRNQKNLKLVETNMRAMNVSSEVFLIDLIHYE